jgi:uncharacterized protein involved in exopolysaccharide biosynthesis
MDKGLMEDEIDLREYIRALLRNWKLIITLTGLATALAVIISLLTPPTYQATALMSVAQPRYALRLDGADAEASPLPTKAYPDLALSDDVVGEVMNQMKSALPPEVDTLSKFRRQLSATLAADPSLLRLTVRDGDPGRAAAIVNTWAQVFVARAGLLYGQDAANLANYEARLAAAKTSLDAAQQALMNFQAVNRAEIISTTLASKQSVLGDYLDRRYQLELLKLDAQDLLNRLVKSDPNAVVGLTDDLAFLSLSERAIGLDGERTPFQVQIGPGESLSGRTVAEQITLVNTMLEAFGARTDDIEAQVIALEPEILQLQGELAEARSQEDELTRAHDLATQQYLALSNKMEEARIAVQESANVVQIASEAAAPTSPVGPRKMLFTALGGALGLLIGMFTAFALEWWAAEASAMRGGQPSSLSAPNAGRDRPQVLSEEKLAAISQPGSSGQGT